MDVLKRIFKKDFIILAGILLVACVSLFPLLQSGYYSDDAIHSIIKGKLQYEHITAFQVTYSEITGWIRTQGRFFPLGWYIFFLYSTVESVVAYKAIILFFILLDILAFGYFIRRITESKSFAFIMMLVIPLFFQFRIYHDPILSFNFLMQLIFLYTFLSLILLDEYLENKKMFYWITSIAFFGLGLLTYEITYLFIILHLLIILRRERNIGAVFKNIWPYFALVIAGGVLTLCLRARATEIQSVYSFNHSLHDYIRTLFVQLIAAIPMIYGYADPYNNIFHLKDFFRNLVLSDVLVSILFVQLLLTSAKGFAGIKNSRFLIVFGCALAFAPALIISLSLRQQGMKFGDGYLPVYIQYFGVLMIAGGIYARLLEKPLQSRTRLYVNSILIFTLVAINLFNMQNNRLVVEVFNKNMHYPRIIVAEALQSGILNQVEENSIIIVEFKAFKKSWDNKYFYYLNSKKKVNVLYEDEFIKEIIKPGQSNQVISKESVGQNIYIVKYEAFSRGRGFFILGRIKSIIYDPSKALLDRVYIDEVRVFEANSQFNCLIGRSFEEKKGNWIKDAAIVLPLEETMLESNSKNYRVYKSLKLQKPIEYKSLGLGLISEQ